MLCWGGELAAGRTRRGWWGLHCSVQGGGEQLLQHLGAERWHGGPGLGEESRSAMPSVVLAQLGM